MISRRFYASAAVAGLLALVLAVPGAAHHDPDDGGSEGRHDELHRRSDPSAELMAHDLWVSDVVSSGPSAKVVKNLASRGRGTRLVGGATTDVWALDGYAYTGTFNTPCGGDPQAGVWVWDVSNPNGVKFVDVIQSPVGSRANDVKVASMNSGDILVHSNEVCGAGGVGGFEIFNVDDPRDPHFLAHVQTDDVNALLRGFGFIDFGVHNLWLFTQGDRDYVAAVVESEFGNFQVFDITDPTNPSLAGFWGAEQIGIGPFPAPHPNENYATLSDFGKILAADAYLFSGFGSSQHRFLHDITVSADGTRAYLSNWDAGLVLLDISDVGNPQLISVAVDPANGSRDGEVNSHAAWPSEDGSIVVETEEDFGAVNLAITILSGPLGAGTAFGGTEDVGGAPPPRFSTTGPITGELVFVGRLCAGDAVQNAAAFDPGDIAVIRRGACSFSEKILNAQALGAGAAVIANNTPFGGAIPNWTAPDPGITIPALFISTVDGDALEASPTGNDATIDPAVLVFGAWGGIRVWDYSDPSNPHLAAIFDTVCSADAGDASCDPAGTYSVHNVVVESLGNKVKAYVSWYWDGMLILDVSDPYNPVEVGRFFDNTQGFLSSNGGNPHDFWGVYKETNSPWIYGSDRNGGLYIFKEQGSGSGK